MWWSINRKRNYQYGLGEEVNVSVMYMEKSDGNSADRLHKTALENVEQCEREGENEAGMECKTCAAALEINCFCGDSVRVFRYGIYRSC